MTTNRYMSCTIYFAVSEGPPFHTSITSSMQIIINGKVEWYGYLHHPRGQRKVVERGGKEERGPRCGVWFLGWRQLAPPNHLEGLWERSSSPSGVWGEAQPEINFFSVFNPTYTIYLGSNSIWRQKFWGGTLHSVEHKFWRGTSLLASGSAAYASPIIRQQIAVACRS